MLDRLREAGFDVLTRNHAEAILAGDFPGETAEIVGALLAFSMPASEILAGGGGEAPSTQRLRRRLFEAGWVKHNFRVQTLLDGSPLGDGTSHEIDHVRRAAAGALALEIEWNNKDPFFDRDLESFQRLHAQSIISVGMIVTRGRRLNRTMGLIVEDFLRREGITEEAGLLPLGMKERTARQRSRLSKVAQKGAGFAAAFARTFVADKFGQATTHWDKLIERTSRGVGNPCPLLLLGLPLSSVSDYSAASDEL